MQNCMRLKTKQNRQEIKKECLVGHSYVVQIELSDRVGVWGEPVKALYLNYIGCLESLLLAKLYAKSNQATF
jgi:hypothetical protein